MPGASQEGHCLVLNQPGLPAAASYISGAKQQFPGCRLRIGAAVGFRTRLCTCRIASVIVFLATAEPEEGDATAAWCNPALVARDGFGMPSS